MKKVKQIRHPEFTDAVRLTPLQLNALRYQEKHTVLTPEILASLSHQSDTAAPH